MTLRPKAVAIGEAMVELASVGDGLYRKGFAGDTFNTAWHMAQVLGDLAQVGYVTRVGTDSISDGFLALLGDDGLDASGVGRDPVRTMGLYLIELDGVERRFHYWRGDSAARGLADDPAALRRALRGADLAILSGVTVAILSASARNTLLGALAEARKSGTRVAFDSNIRPRLWLSVEETRQTLAEFIATADITLPSFDDESLCWGDATPETTAERHLAAGAREVVVKNGAGDVHVRAGGRRLTIETPAVGDVRDTSGAGDAFNAGYLASRLIGRDIPASVAYGQELAAQVIRTYGARAEKDKVRAMGLSMTDSGGGRKR